MACEIDKKDTFFEINISGKISTFDILAVVYKLSKLDPGKHYPDLWSISPEVQVPYSQFNKIAVAIGNLFMKPPVSKKSAFIACDAFQEAQLEMYKQAAYKLPLDIQIFTSREDAISWINDKE